MLRKNSLETYGMIVEGLSESRRKVFDTIQELGNPTRQEIAGYLCVPINQVTGRVRELMDMMLITETGTDRTSGKPRARLKAYV